MPGTCCGFRRTTRGYDVGQPLGPSIDGFGVQAIRCAPLNQPRSRIATYRTADAPRDKFKELVRLFRRIKK